MAGHSKWANIKHRKAAQDAKRGKVFTKLIRELVTAARQGGPEPDANPRLRAAIDKALSNNMKRDTVDNAVKRGAGDSDGDNMETIIYEGYGPGGTAVMVETLTDNRNRTVAAVRHAFSKSGGNLGTDGSVAYLFTKKGVISYSSDIDEEALMEAALDAGADDVVSNNDCSFDVFTIPDEFGQIKDVLDASGFTAIHAEVSLIAATTARLDVNDAPKLLRLVDMLEDCDDVQEVYSNAEISEDVLNAMDQE